MATAFDGRPVQYWNGVLLDVARRTPGISPGPYSRAAAMLNTAMYCGARATHNARTVGRAMVVEGAQVVVGDVDRPGAEVGYEVLCRRHHRKRMTSAAVRGGDAVAGRAAGRRGLRHRFGERRSEVPILANTWP